MVGGGGFTEFTPPLHGCLPNLWYSAYIAPSSGSGIVWFYRDGVIRCLETDTKILDDLWKIVDASKKRNNSLTIYGKTLKTPYRPKRRALSDCPAAPVLPIVAQS